MHFYFNVFLINVIGIIVLKVWKFNVTDIFSSQVFSFYPFVDILKNFFPYRIIIHFAFGI